MLSFATYRTPWPGKIIGQGQLPGNCSHSYMGRDFERSLSSEIITKSAQLAAQRTREFYRFVGEGPLHVIFNSSTLMITQFNVWIGIEVCSMLIEIAHITLVFSLIWGLHMPLRLKYAVVLAFACRVL